MLTPDGEHERVGAAKPAAGDVDELAATDSRAAVVGPADDAPADRRAADGQPQLDPAPSPGPCLRHARAEPTRPRPPRQRLQGDVVAGELGMAVALDVERAVGADPGQEPAPEPAGQPRREVDPVHKGEAVAALGATLQAAAGARVEVPDADRLLAAARKRDREVEAVTDQRGRVGDRDQQRAAAVDRGAEANLADADQDRALCRRPRAAQGEHEDQADHQGGSGRRRPDLASPGSHHWAATKRRMTPTPGESNG